MSVRSAGAEVDALDRFRGCLLAGAAGDALGAQIEFLRLSEIRDAHGDRIDLADVAPARFTDDTQMTLFTAEGLIRANVRSRSTGTTSITSVVHHAYLRWLHTQGVSWPSAAARVADGGEGPDGWLVQNTLLHRQEAPGNTCLSALRSGRMGTPTEKLNNSKGCGGVMRAAPAGLFFEDPRRAFEVGCDIAAITHSHPSGYLSAGALAAMASRLVAGASMEEAVAGGRELLVGREGAEETLAALDAAVALAASGVPKAEELEELGGGWVGEEALAIAVACALTAQDLPQALSTAVVHSGDSDSTGAICGNLLGAAWGALVIPEAWGGLVEGWDVVDDVARDLWREAFDPPVDAGDVPAEWEARYPGW